MLLYLHMSWIYSRNSGRHWYFLSLTFSHQPMHILSCFLISMHISVQYIHYSKTKMHYSNHILFYCMHNRMWWIKMCKFSKLYLLSNQHYAMQIYWYQMYNYNSFIHNHMLVFKLQLGASRNVVATLNTTWKTQLARVFLCAYLLNGYCGGEFPVGYTAVTKYSILSTL